MGGRLDYLVPIRNNRHVALIIKVNEAIYKYMFAPCREGVVLFVIPSPSFPLLFGRETSHISFDTTSPFCSLPASATKHPRHNTSTKMVLFTRPSLYALIFPVFYMEQYRDGRGRVLCCWAPYPSSRGVARDTTAAPVSAKDATDTRVPNTDDCAQIGQGSSRSIRRWPARRRCESIPVSSRVVVVVHPNTRSSILPHGPTP